MISKFLHLHFMILLGFAIAPAMAAEPSTTFTVQQKVGLRKLEMAAIPDANQDKQLQPNELLATIPQKFAGIDKNNNKNIDQSEVEQAINLFRARFATVYGTSTEAHASRVKSRYAQMDKNKDGLVSYAEFVTYFGARYASMDANHDGVITVDEYRVDAEKLEIGL